MSRARRYLRSGIFGFTFVELLVVLLISALITSLAVPIIQVKLLNDAALRYARSLKSRIEYAVSMCLPHVYNECMLAFSSDLISRSSLINIAASSNRKPLQNYYGDINYVQIIRNMPYVSDVYKDNTLAFHSRDDQSNYYSDFYTINAVGVQDGNYYKRFFVSIINGTFGDYRGAENALYVYPTMLPGDSEFSYGRIYKIKLLGASISMCEISFSSCPNVAWDDVKNCDC